MHQLFPPNSLAGNQILRYDKTMNPHELPVYQQKDKILSALQENQVIVVESPTGSGKTTQLPIILHEAGYGERGIIGVTQPRRIAVLSVSDFISRQVGCTVGELVGYKMRFEDKTGTKTKIKIMTDGILLQELKLDPYLSKYQIIMVDEAHERSLNIDFILGLLKKIIEARHDFKVIVSSATINAEVFSEYFGECPIVKIETQTYPVTVIYDPIAESTEEKKNMDSGAKAAESSVLRYSDEALYEKIHAVLNRTLENRDEGERGDILIFLPGEKTIKGCMVRLAASPIYPLLHLVPLYARLGKDEQERVFDPAPEGKIKVILATNIAETSVTIDGVTVVIDSGLAKLNYYNPRTFTSSLIEAPIAKASCNQRKGRAGRTAPGVCYRLYARKDFESRPLFTTEEIYRTDLSEVVLRMAELGITDFENFDFISKPPKSGIAGAIDVLNLLDSLNPDRTLSSTGQMMCAFPLLPRLSRMIVEAIMKYPDVLHEVLVAAAFLSTMSPYVLPPGQEIEARSAHHAFRDPMGDFITYLRLFEAFSAAPNKTRFCEKNFLDERTMFEIVRIREQLEIIVSDMGVPILRGGSKFDYLCAVSRGLIQFVCARQERGLFRSLTAEKIQIHPGSAMYRENPEFIVAGEIVRTTRMYAMSVSPLPREILQKISPVLASRLLAIAPSGRKEERQGARKTSKRIPESSRSAAVQNGADASASRDFTNQIKIGSQVFDIKPAAGKRKKVMLDWAKFKLVIPELDRDAGEAFKGLLGCVNFNGYLLLDNEKLATILKIGSWLSLDADFTKSWPRGKNFETVNQDGSVNAEGFQNLANHLHHVFQVVPANKKEKSLGFVTLFTDGNGNFWFKISRGFHTALNESLSSLESLADIASKDSVPVQEREKVGALYRRLSAFFDE